MAIRKFKDFLNESNKPELSEKLDADTWESIKQHFDDGDVKKVESEVWNNKKPELYLVTTVVDEDYPGFDGADDYFDSEGHDWMALEVIEKSKHKLDIIAEAHDGEGTYYTVLGPRSVAEGKFNDPLEWSEHTADAYGKSKIVESEGHTCKKLCNECPFSKKSIPGWLADYEVQDFVDFHNAEAMFPCHMAMGDHENLTPEEADEAIRFGHIKLCRGFVESMIKSGKLPKYNKFLRDEMAKVKAEGLSDESMTIWDFKKHHEKE